MQVGFAESSVECREIGVVKVRSDLLSFSFLFSVLYLYHISYLLPGRTRNTFFPLLLPPPATITPYLDILRAQTSFAFCIFVFTACPIVSRPDSLPNPIHSWTWPCRGFRSCSLPSYRLPAGLSANALHSLLRLVFPPVFSSSTGALTLKSAVISSSLVPIYWSRRSRSDTMMDGQPSGLSNDLSLGSFRVSNDLGLGSDRVNTAQHRGYDAYLHLFKAHIDKTMRT
jgi:hypothetical protein